MAASNLLDASVIVAAYIEGHPIAKRIFTKEAALHLSPHTLLEIANALRYKRVSPETLAALLSHLRSLNLTTLESSEADLTEAFVLATETNTSLYDALYHVLAFRYGLIFVNLDKKYYEKAKHLGNIILLN